MTGSVIGYILLNPRDAWRRGMRLAGILLCLFMSAGVAVAETGPPKPTGAVILSVTGNVTVTNQEDRLDFDLDMLASLPVTKFQTRTPWTHGVVSFEGVSLLDFLEFCGVSEGVLDAVALNDYRISVPVDDAVPGGPILAYRRDGQLMSVRDKGPIWLIYPFDDNPEYQSEPVQSRAIWQLRLIEVRNE